MYTNTDLDLLSNTAKEEGSSKKGRKSTASTDDKAPAAKRKSSGGEDKKIGFDRGLEPEEILGNDYPLNKKDTLLTLLYASRCH